MNIAINLLGMHPDQGGMYQYAITFTRHLLNRDRENNYVVFFDFAGVLNERFDLTRANLVRVDRPLALGLTLFGRLFWAPASPTAQRLLHRISRMGPAWRRCFQGEYSIFCRHNTQFLIQPSHVRPDALFAQLPYLIAIHDAPYQWSDEHRARRSQHFLKWYEWLIGELAGEAKMILVDSPSGMDAMAKGYEVQPDRIRILPFRPPDYVTASCDHDRMESVKAKYRLPESFIFYPSKLLAHKNHQVLIEAISLLRRQQNVTLHLVLAGSASRDGTLERINSLVDQHELGGQVHYLGYVPDEDMAALYSLALAMVFPTLMGPTALPILEGFAAGCPVVCSNVEGYPEQVGDAGLLFDPNNADELALALLSISTDSALRATLSEKGAARLQVLTAGDYGDSIFSALHDCLASGQNAR